MLRMRVRPLARADLLDIWKYIAAESEPAAEKVLSRIHDVFRLLESQPEAGKSRAELSPGLRSFPAGKYVIFYQVRERSVDIIRVLSGYRDVAELFN